MQYLRSLHAFSYSKQLALSALFSALCCVCTISIVIPLPIGYFNIGDVVTLLAGWCLGPFFGAIAAGIGGALADIISGFPIYAPATFIIKASVAVIAYMVWSFLKKYFKKDSWDIFPRAFSAILGESIMIAGYFFYDCLLYGLATAAGGLTGNLLQGFFCMFFATLIIAFLYRNKNLRTFFPKMTPPNH